MEGDVRDEVKDAIDARFVAIEMVIGDLLVAMMDNTYCELDEITGAISEQILVCRNKEAHEMTIHQLERILQMISKIYPSR